MVTIFQNILDTNTPFYVSVDTIFNRIRDGKKCGELVKKIRSEKDKDKQNELKKGLAAICFSGEFSKRSDNSIVKHSGLICLDFDNFKTSKDMKDAKDGFKKDEFTNAVFVSPSGKGLKVIVKIPNDIDNHKLYFNALRDYYNAEEFDVTSKNLSRVCYESHDPDIYVNENSEVWTEKIIDSDVTVDRSAGVPTITIDDDNEKVSRLMKWFEKNYSMSKGQRNNNLYILSSAFNQYGVDKNLASFVCLNKYQTKGFGREEIQRTIDSAYSNRGEFGTKAFEDTDKIHKLRRQVKSGATNRDIVESLEEEGITGKDAKTIISSITEKAMEDVKVFWSKNDKGSVNIVHHLFKEFLEDNGFYKYYPQGSSSFIFIRKISNRVMNTSEQEIKDFVLNYISERVDDMSVWNFFADKTRFFKEDFLSMLNDIDISFVEDNEDLSYLFFKNVAVKVTRDSVEEVEYENLPGWVWEDQMIDRDFDKCDGSLCEFRKFINNICDNDSKRINSVESTVGFLMHAYKPPSKCPAVILNDEIISENPEGGTGKGIFATAVGHLRKSVEIDGKMFSFDRSFLYQTVQQDTQVLVFDDVAKGFNFEKLFSVITQGITLEKKNKDAIKIPFEKSPKILISTNYALRGSGNSFDRRKFELEFKQYYRKDFTPREEFGHDLFTDWNSDEWCIFDNYMISNLQKYLNYGLIEADFNNLHIRKFIAETNHDFYEFISDPVNGYKISDKRYYTNNIYEKFVEEYPDYAPRSRRQISRKMFNFWLSRWGQFHFGADALIDRDAKGKYVEFKRK
jgi:hypothetical protein